MIKTHFNYLYTGQGNKIKVDGVFLYCRVNYMTFKMLINLTHVQTDPDIFKIAVLKKRLRHTKKRKIRSM